MGEPLVDRRRAEEETGTEIADEIGSLAERRSVGGSIRDGVRINVPGTHVAHGTTEKVETLSVGDVPVLALGGTTEDDLRGLGSSGEGSDVGDTSALDGHEGEEESEEDGEDGHADGHVVLDAEDNANADDRQNQTRSPHPHLDLLVGSRGILYQVFFRLRTSLLGPSKFATKLLANSVKTSRGTAVDGLESEEKDLVLEDELGERDRNHEKHTGPQEPVTRRWPVLVASSQAERSEIRVSIPLGALSKVGAPGHVVVHESGSNDGPGQDGATEEREGDVQTDQHTRTDESRSPLEEPTPRLDRQSEGVVVGPDVEPCEEVPVPENADSVLRHDTEDEGTNESNGQSLHLQLRHCLTSHRLMHRANRHGRSRGRREDEAELTRDVDDEELAQRRSEEEAKISRDSRESDNLQVVVLRGRPEELELVHGREGGDENVGKTTGGHGRGLTDVVLTGAKASA